MYQTYSHFYRREVNSKINKIINKTAARHGTSVICVCCVSVVCVICSDKLLSSFSLFSRNCLISHFTCFSSSSPLSSSSSLVRLPLENNKHSKTRFSSLLRFDNNTWLANLFQLFISFCIKSIDSLAYRHDTQTQILIRFSTKLYIEPSSFPSIDLTDNLKTRHSRRVKTTFPLTQQIDQKTLPQYNIISMALARLLG